MNTKLFAHEWLAVITIVAAAIGLSGLALLDEEPPTSSPRSQPLSVSTISVTIRGAVAQPGRYEVPAGAIVDDLLTLASPLPSADLRRLNRQSSLRNGRDIVVSEYPTITVFLTGAVEEEGPVKLKRGTLMQDLLQYGSFRKDADTSALNKRRRLKDQQVIDVPSVKK